MANFEELYHQVMDRLVRITEEGGIVVDKESAFKPLTVGELTSLAKFYKSLIPPDPSALPDAPKRRRLTAEDLPHE